MFMIMFVLDDPGRLDAVLEGWEKAGIRGATIVESTGLQRLRKQNLPMRYLFQTSSVVEEGHVTLFVIVDNEQVVQRCLQVTENIVTDLEHPHSGVFAAWPLMVVRGVKPRSQEG